MSPPYAFWWTCFPWHSKPYLPSISLVHALLEGLFTEYAGLPFLFSYIIFCLDSLQSPFRSPSAPSQSTVIETSNSGLVGQCQHHCNVWQVHRNYIPYRTCKKPPEVTLCRPTTMQSISPPIFEGYTSRTMFSPGCLASLESSRWHWGEPDLTEIALDTFQNSFLATS